VSIRISGGLVMSVLFVVAVAASRMLVADARTLGPTLESPQRPSAEQHCIGQAFKVGSAPAVAPAPSCFQTFAEAIEAATAGAVKLASDARPNSLRPSHIRPSTQTVIGIDYVDAYYQGNTFTWWVSNPNGCSDGTTYWVDSIPLAWQNNVSSATTWAGCTHYFHYEGVYQSGTVIDCTCATMGVMNDKTVSEKWQQ
jgi:hypothetical protein